MWLPVPITLVSLSLECCENSVWLVQDYIPFLSSLSNSGSLSYDEDITKSVSGLKGISPQQNITGQPQSTAFPEGEIQSNATWSKRLSFTFSIMMMLLKNLSMTTSCNFVPTLRDAYPYECYSGVCFLSRIFNLEIYSWIEVPPAWTRR